jgi:uncharacterized protein
MSIGSTDPLDFDYLERLKTLAARVDAVWISDHLCFTGVLGRNTHDLLPLPYTEACLRHVVDRVRIVQDFLERPLVLENPSTYIEFAGSTLSESQFFGALLEEADAAALIDVNNIYVSSFNHGFDANGYLRDIPRDRVVQFHLAGHTDYGTHIIDTHAGPVIAPVWELFRAAYQQAGGASTLLEWDADIPPFEVVLEEARRAEAYASLPRTPRSGHDRAKGSAGARSEDPRAPSAPKPVKRGERAE